MTTMRLLSRRAGLALGASLLLAGCSTVNQYFGSEESVDYRSTVAGDPLSIPPDLTQANRNAQFRAPEGATTYSQYAQAQGALAAAGNRDNVLPTLAGIEVRRDGDMRWLVVDQPAEALFSKVIDFWFEQGFTIQSQDPRAGLIQTDWAENRAKIPEGWIRSALGGILDQVFDSGERERFRTRLERVNGRTEIYISHQHMVETPSGESTFQWAYGKEDPGLNAAMLARLMVFLGLDVERARDLVAQSEQQKRQAQIAQAAEGGSVLRLNESFDRAWRRVGLAIDSANFSVEDRDRSSGEFFIRYLDSDTGYQLEQPGFFSRLFGARTTEAPSFRIHVADQGSTSVVSVRDTNGRPMDDDTAKRIINVLSTHMSKGE